MIVHLNGWPGVGKKTIGDLVSKKLEARFIHNHVLHDVSFACAGYGDIDRWPLYEKVRSAAYEVLKGRPSHEVFVMTNALCKDVTREIDAWGHVVDLAMHRKVPLIPIVLTASLTENEKRVASPERVNKLQDPKYLREMVGKYDIQSPSVPETKAFDVTQLSAMDAANEVVDYVNNISTQCMPATTKHLEFD